MAASEQPSSAGGNATSESDFPPAQTRAAFYDENVQDVSDEARALLTRYSGYPDSEVLPRVLKLRDIAFTQHHYACIGQMRFLLYNLRLLPFHGKVIDRLKSGAVFMDAGCCFGQEVRYLIHREGISPQQVFGFDVEKMFIDLGFELFRDKDSLGDHFVSGDVLAEPGSPEGAKLSSFDGKIDMIFCSSFLHVWPWDEMIKATKRLVQLTRGRSGSIICGKQLASRQAGHYAMPTPYGRNYRHNEETMSRFWDQVGQETGTKWTLESGFYQGIELDQNRTHAWSEPDQGMLWFCATKE